MNNACYQLGLLYGGPILTHFVQWLQRYATADRIDCVLFFTPAGSALDLFIPSEVFPRRASLNESRLWFDLASVNESRIAQEISDLNDDGFRGLAPWQALARMGVPPPGERVMADIGLGDEVLLTDSAMPAFRAFLQAYKWEIFKVCLKNRRSLFQRLVRFGVEPGMRLAIVDASWDLSRQAAFERALRRLFPAWVAGYHFCLKSATSPSESKDIAKPEAVRSFASAELALPNRPILDMFFGEPVSPEFAAGIQDSKRKPVNFGLAELFLSLSSGSSLNAWNSSC